MRPAPPEGWTNSMQGEDKTQKDEESKPKWESGILSCTTDWRINLLGSVCPCVLFGLTKGQGDESCCFHSCIAFCSLPWVPFLCLFRESVRVRYGIRGSVFTDFFLSAFCPCCVLFQIYEHMRNNPFTDTSQLGFFSSGVLQCRKDIPTCLLVSCCPCLGYGILRRKMGSSCKIHSLCCFLFFPCLHGACNRSYIRSRYGIKYSYLSVSCCRTQWKAIQSETCNSCIDLGCWLALPCCALAQELRHVRKNPFVIYVKDKDGVVTAMAN
uniref:Uncharacterized protein n=1 Tax=Guillardia theta TaxID=55529 RepID=A0A7S4L7J2_GUITH